MSKRRPTVRKVAHPKKPELAERGRDMVVRFLEANGWDAIRFGGSVPKGDSCGLYERDVIFVSVDRCAGIGVSGACWSYPGHIIDRTPYGVYAHELGHHVDARYRWTLSKTIRTAAKEEKLTNYCPNNEEWFAEMFRLYLTNPDLLARIRPNTFKALTGVGLITVEKRSWRDVLASAPERTVKVVQKRLREVEDKNLLTDGLQNAEHLLCPHTKKSKSLRN